MVKLSMPAGLLLEAAIAGGIEGDHLLDVIKNKNISALRHIGKEESSWLYFFRYAEENWDDIVLALKDGFTFKFITIRGLQNLLQTKFSLKENDDFQMGETWLELNLCDSQLKILKSYIPNQWAFVRQENSIYNFRAVVANTQKIV
jgi:hypothetical protein